MTVNYIEKSIGLHAKINAQGYHLQHINAAALAFDASGNQSAEIDTAVQAIIDKFDPLPDAQAEAKELVKEASATQRLKYVTQAAGKDAEYTYKALEATQFGIDGSIGVFMQGRISATGETPLAIATEWNANALAWLQIGASIAGLEDKANMLINAETDWKNCVTIANSIVAQIEGI